MFLRYIHNFRAIAILVIVAGHCTWILTWDNYPYPVIGNLAMVLFMNGTVLFVFIAGFLFQHLSANFAYQPYLLEKIRYVILPYIACSIPAIGVKLSAASSTPSGVPQWLSGISVSWPSFAKIIVQLKDIGWYLLSGDSLTPLGLEKFGSGCASAY